MRVVGEDEQGLPGGGRRQQVGDCQSHQEPVRHLTRGLPEGGVYSFGLPGRQITDAVAQRAQKLMKPGVRQARLGRHAGGGEDLQIVADRALPGQSGQR